MLLRVGLQADINILDRMRYHFSVLKGVKMTNISDRSKAVILISLSVCDCFGVSFCTVFTVCVPR